jgi:cell division protein FtsB
MRVLTVILLLLIGAMHAELWLGKNGVGRVRELADLVEQQKAANDDLRDRNARLAAEVSDLQNGLESIEEQARFELGMVRPDEILVQYTAKR